ncbi:MAG: hypothetical protein ACK5JG_21740, partial [Pseudomonadota bacterium]
MVGKRFHGVPEAASADSAAGETPAGRRSGPDGAPSPAPLQGKPLPQSAGALLAAHESGHGPGRPPPRERVGLTLALVLSLALHALLLGLQFGGDGRGLPGFDLPWRERRVDVPDLRLVLMPARPARPARPAPARRAAGRA